MRCSVIKKEAKKMLKYKDLTVETQHMRNVKAKVIPVINDRQNLNHLKIIQKISKLNTWKA
jgi:hypothetical protein